MEMKKGFIKISDAIIKDMWSEIYIFLKDFKPTHIEFRYWENNVWYYWGNCEFFDVVNEGEVVPQYNVIFNKEIGGKLTYKFEKVTP